MESIGCCVPVIIGKLKGAYFSSLRVELWNGIPLYVHKKDTVGSFKSALKNIFSLVLVMCIMFLS